MIRMTSKREMLEAIARAEMNGLSVGLVPTMGFLHEGHVSLIERARRENDRVVVSIFVNPTQFGPQEDFDSYPRDLQHDMAICQAAGADWVFNPSAGEMYPCDPTVSLDAGDLGRFLCGSRRPGHFAGVMMVVSKLFNICRPTRAYFGEKDYQQLAIIRKMAADLDFPVEIVGCPIVREADGLAKSSRNSYLDKQQRQAALVVPKAMALARSMLEHGERDAGKIISSSEQLVASEPLARIDYLSIVDLNTLQPVQTIDRPVLVAAAVYIGKTRLIDNLIFAPQTKED